MARPEQCPSQDPRVLLFGELTDATARLERRVDADLRAQCDLSLPWFETLLSLKRSPEGRLTMGEIAAAINHSDGGTTRLVDRMVEAGLLERTSCPTDRRAIHVIATDQGRERLDEALTVHVDVLAGAVTQSLSDAERSELARLLSKLRSAL